MESYKIIIFGHRNLNPLPKTEERLYEILRNLVHSQGCVDLYIGRDGAFDILVASVFKRAQQSFGKENLQMTLVLPYVKKDIEYYEKYYDSILIPEHIKKSHPKGVITKRNRWMVEECDLLICYVEREWGGAYTAMKYAQRLGKRIVNLATVETNETQ